LTARHDERSAAKDCEAEKVEERCGVKCHTLSSWCEVWRECSAEGIMLASKG
jgi:hypothetical protein